MIGDNLVVEKHDDALGMRPHQNHPTCRPGIDAVTSISRSVEPSSRWLPISIIALGPI
jgi:hypothetical protein